MVFLERKCIVICKSNNIDLQISGLEVSTYSSSLMIGLS